MPRLKITNTSGKIPIDILKDPEISLKAKGLYAFIQSKPDDWKLSIKNISKQTSDGVDSISSGLKELKKHGLLIRQRVQNEKGYWGVVYILKSDKIKNT